MNLLVFLGTCLPGSFINIQCCVFSPLLSLVTIMQDWHCIHGMAPACGKRVMILNLKSNHGCVYSEFRIVTQKNAIHDTCISVCSTPYRPGLNTNFLDHLSEGK